MKKAAIVGALIWMTCQILSGVQAASAASNVADQYNQKIEAAINQ
jgi:hypothetical protein